MTDAPEFEMTDADTEMLGEDAEAVQAAAKKSFSLVDRLQGAKLATAKVLVFTDLDAATAWQEKEREVAMHQASLGLAAAAEKPDTDEIEAAEGALSEVEAERDVLRDAAFRGALALHMRAAPQVALEAAQRQARHDFAGDDGQVPEASREDFYRRQDEILMGKVVLRIVDAEGNEAEFDRKTLHKMLRDALPVPQFVRVTEAYNRLMFNDSLQRAATADPGF